MIKRYFYFYGCLIEATLPCHEKNEMLVKHSDHLADRQADKEALKRKDDLLRECLPQLSTLSIVALHDNEEEVSGEAKQLLTRINKELE